MTALNLARATTSVGPVIPKFLVNHVELRTTCVLTEHEARLFAAALNALSAQLESESRDLKGWFLTGLIVDEDTVSLTFCPEQLGSECAYAMYPIHRWRSQKLADLKVLTCILEELCHYFYTIRDEECRDGKSIEDFVTLVAQRIAPGVETADLYPGLCRK